MSVLRCIRELRELSTIDFCSSSSWWWYKCHTSTLIGLDETLQVAPEERQVIQHGLYQQISHFGTRHVAVGLLGLLDEAIEHHLDELLLELVLGAGIQVQRFDLLYVFGGDGIPQRRVSFVPE